MQCTFSLRLATYVVLPSAVSLPLLNLTHSFRSLPPRIMSNYVDPSALHLSSPLSPLSATSPEPEAGPSRKRPRSETSSEERKEARAHRNRIAAQNSRDRRKAQFSYLERRVAELEEENRRLRAGIPAPIPGPLIPVSSTRDDQREQENEELKERIKTLERGWEAVIKALAAQGVQTFSAPAQTTPTTAPPSSSPSTSIDTTFTAFPSPAPSHSSLDLTPSASLFTTSTTTESESNNQPAHEPTRHLARVATIESDSMSLQRVVSPRLISSHSSLLVARKHPLSALRAPRSRTTHAWMTSSARYLSLHRASRTRPCLILMPSSKHRRRPPHPPRRK